MRFNSYFKIVQTKFCSRSIKTVLTRESEAVKLLSLVLEPITNQSLGSLGSLQTVSVDPNGTVKVDIDLFVPGYPFVEQVVERCRDVMKQNTVWAKDLRFRQSPARKSGSVLSLQSSTLSQVGHVIGVSSCKGGVGKSTVAVNLALVLSLRGLKVGILDADVYGPSLPLLLQAKDTAVYRSESNEKHILPLESVHGRGLKMLSFGHVNSKSGAPGSGGKAAAVVRGPIVSKIINQLLLSTEWGDLDYLIVDMPPGTGDIQITLTQSISLSGAVIVTTPHALSLLDAAKGVAMFEDLKVPTLSVVENMSHFTCEHGTRYYPFGRGGRDKLLRALTAPLGEGAMERLKNCPIRAIPLVPEPEEPVSPETTDLTGLLETKHQQPLAPLAVREPHSEAAQAYCDLADDVISEIFRSQTEAVLIPTVSYNASRRVLLLRYFSSSSATELSLPVEELRMRDPQSGERVPGRIAADYSALSPEKFDFKGRYGVAPVWSDGYYTDIFPFHVLRKIAEELHLQS